MDDLHRAPGEKDRAALVGRITRVHAEGRIGEADRDIRIGNVRSAASMAEIALMSRDLDQLEATLPAATPTPASAGPWSTFEPGSTRGASAWTFTGNPTAVRVIAVLIGVAVVLVAVVIFLLGLGALPFAADDGPRAGPREPVVRVEPADPAGAAYALTEPGIRWFLSTYRQKFGTSEVVDLTLYGDYVVVQVPVPGKSRQTGWLFRRDSGWTDFGGTRAVFPGAVPVDTTRLDVNALVANINRARGALNVERPNQAYVVVRDYRPGQEAPSVDIHVTNQFRESGYAATTLDGTVERTYPYAP